jgi:mono/diheme cytochrome c family protein
MGAKWRGLAAGAVLVLGLAACSPAVKPPPAAVDTIPHVAADSPIEAGRYLVLVGGCNDCHTPGFARSGGATPEPQQLAGNPVGYRGPWGTSYAGNLRMLAAKITEDAWVELLTTKRFLPPMPSHNISKMDEADLRAIYAYVHYLGGEWTPAPVNLPPGETPKGPYEDMSVVTPAP